MGIKRDIYLNKLISKKHNGLIKVVIVIRRCGKSYLLFNLFKEHLLAEGTDEQHIIEIAFSQRSQADKQQDIYDRIDRLIQNKAYRM